MNDRIKKILEENIKRGWLKELGEKLVVEMHKAYFATDNFWLIYNKERFTAESKQYVNFTDILFNTDACKFWFGEELVCNRNYAEDECQSSVELICDECRWFIPSYQYHQMKLAILQPDERISYIEENRKDK